MIDDLTDDNFYAYIRNSKVPVLIEFWATWCGFCTKQQPILDKVAENYKSSIKFGRINIEQAPKTAQDYGAFSIPTFVLFKDGKEKRKIRGLQTEQQLKLILDEVRD